jgi:succinoglycan biosynthesis protein ExoA
MERRIVSRKDVLVVIPCLNEETHIAPILESVLRDPAAADFSIIVADGGSADRTVEIVSSIANTSDSVVLMPNRRRIQSAGIKEAARLFGDDKRWLVRIDAHGDYPEGYVSKLIAEAERTHATSVVVAMESRGSSCFQTAAAIAQNSVLGAGGARHRTVGSTGFVDHGHHALFDMKAFRAAAGYDESQSHNEDAELDCRLRKAGGRIWLTNATHMVYYPRSSAISLFQQFRNYGRGRALTILRHRQHPKLRQLLPAAVLPCLLLLIAAPLVPLAAVPAILWIGVCLSYGAVLGLSNRSLCGFASGISAMIMHSAWSIGFWTPVLTKALSRSPKAAILLGESP